VIRSLLRYSPASLGSAMDDPAEPPKRRTGRTWLASLLVVLAAVLLPEAGFLDGFEAMPSAALEVGWHDVEPDPVDAVCVAGSTPRRCVRQLAVGSQVGHLSKPTQRTVDWPTARDEPVEQEPLADLNGDRAPPST
jgi:hypothetical protein